MADTAQTARVTLARNPWLALLQTCDCEGADRLTGATLWWMAVRPCVFPMSLMSVLIGVLLAVPAGPFGWREAALTLLVVIGAVAAHAGNNLLNDYIDVQEGIDREGYFRTEYAPHPILSGQLSARQVLAGAAVVHAVDAVVLALLVWAAGWGVAWFALAGLFLSIAYVLPPFSFKRRGLGELTAAVVWGPLMIVGAYYALRSAAPASVWLLSLPYGILVGAVLVITGATGPWVLLALLALPRLRLLHVVYANERPAQPPEGYPVWPLWYVAFAMIFIRTAGGWFVLGLLLNQLL